MMDDMRKRFIILLFTWEFLTVIFALLYTFQAIGLLALGEHILFIAMLFLSFLFVKNNKVNQMIAVNLSVGFVILILWFSHRTFLYIQNEATLFIFFGAIFIAELFGGFWGYQFAKSKQEMVCDNCQ